MKQNIKLDSSNLKILVCCHKKCDLPDDDVFLPVHVGAAISDEDLGIQRDDRCGGMPCDNISDKNKSYCELTAIYWAWKNIRKIYPGIEYIGVNHYRRYFLFTKISRRITSIDFKSMADINTPIVPEKIKLDGDTIITYRKVFLSKPVFIKYCVAHISDDYRILKNAVEKLYPDYYGSFINVFEKNDIFYPCNMFIMPWSIFDKYCEWLFTILKEVESKSNYKTYNPVQQRVFGYIAERMLGVFIYHNKLKNIGYPAAFINPKTEGTVHRNSWQDIIKQGLRSIRNAVS